MDGSKPLLGKWWFHQTSILKRLALEFQDETTNLPSSWLWWIVKTVFFCSKNWSVIVQGRRLRLQIKCSFWARLCQIQASFSRMFFSKHFFTNHSKRWSPWDSATDHQEKQKHISSSARWTNTCTRWWRFCASLNRKEIVPLCWKAPLHMTCSKVSCLLRPQISSDGKESWNHLHRKHQTLLIAASHPSKHSKPTNKKW